MSDTHTDTAVLTPHPSAPVPLCIVSEASLGVRLWVWLADHAIENVAQVSLSTLAEELEATVRGVQKAIERLERQGAIVRRPGGGQPTSYVLLVL